ncbi:bifunctional diaminohydroxyphosphoribosylaminopyrimidine deaminase/5-amino-6-(5-phosphoribosylamino)uracil reductase RibD [Moraxella nasovis]|uniref:bifunctional diaminohydroxyphosphoribosylaminopyrimidine deaminase/5-amino-6-(5-phosphoribosylamino)uracil reductase RibD n=1 Tax=Moraxella nasovis TaxID=2904121 RepID=UPI001F61C889|nr:bifunctional diaminohydroxyphosphoribosylaminopyrimidine deaminase/5-amino-6-(5-phosphoribosylamino)uracil reductase RibD [Moraxella nasovis]UNU72498.1 bifunctional diaminohydroxyphosphoribosylaminopyrimidine deaminase/5-amino-6-(5-phosphoribosylamino)uracil reductase RibD [Moraxella nasovis]
MTDSSDYTFMQAALGLAKKGLYTTRPNPCVGCVIVKDNLIIGQGFHPKAGLPHAEIYALNDAKAHGYDIKGATAYVTLEPCSHYGQTPPCSKALIESGINKVIIATFDPNPQVAGRGISMLQNAGIDTQIGVCEREARKLNAGFLKAMATGLPYVRVKIATSLDGRTAMASGESKWITGEMARIDVQKLRARSGAIITGSRTVLADNPALTVRLDTLDLVNISPPKIVVMDRTGKLKNTDNYQVFNNKNTLLWQDDIKSLLQTLVSEYQCYDVLVEAGSTLATSFLIAGFVDELIVYQAPCLLGKTARAMFDGKFDQLADRLSFNLESCERLGDDLKMTFGQKPQCRK